MPRKSIFKPMSTAIRQTVVVDAAGRITLQHPLLHEGMKAELICLIEDSVKPAFSMLSRLGSAKGVSRSASQILDDLQQLREDPR